MMKIGVSSYSYMQALRNGSMTLMDTIKNAAELGFEGYEVVDFVFTSQIPEGKTKVEFAKEIKAECEKYGLTITNYTCGADFQATDLDAEIARLKECVDIAEILGASGLRHDVAHGLSAEGKYESFESILPRLVKGITAVTEYAATKGIKTMSENHGFFAQDALRVERLINAVNNPNYRWLVDMGNFTCADEKPAISVGIAAPYACYVHAKDFIVKPASGANPGKYFFRSRGGNYLRGTIVGQGDVDVKACLAALRNAGYDGFVSIEFEGMEDCVLALEAGRENLVRYINEIEEIPLKKLSF